MKICEAPNCDNVPKGEKSRFCSLDHWLRNRPKRRYFCMNNECGIDITEIRFASKYCSTNCRMVTKPNTPMEKKPRCIYCKKRFYAVYNSYICNNCKDKIKKNRRKNK